MSTPSASFVITVMALAIALCTSAQPVPSKEIQIAGAVLAAPEESKAAATVYGYAPDGSFTLLRKGTNSMICLSDDPAQKGFSVSCYHKDLEPFMARGRELKKEGKSQQEIFDIREKEAKSKKLKMPANPASLFVLTADSEKYNPATGAVKDTYLRYVVYIPFATAESTGLPVKPTLPGMPWIMDPGTHRAHIMISPPQP